MKRRVLPLVLVLLLLGGCSLRNRQSSDDFAPSGYVPRQETAQGGQSAWGEQPQTPGIGEASLPAEGPVKTVLQKEGEIPYSNPPRTYRYLLPMIDLPGAYAAGCSQELESRYGTLIQQSLDAIAAYEEPVLASLTYTTFTYGSLLTLRLDRQDTDGTGGRAYYTVNAQTGDAPTVEEFLTAAGLEGDLEELLRQAVNKEFVRRYGQDDQNTAWTTALTRSLAALGEVDVHRLHLTETGALAAACTLCSLQGDTDLVELTLG